MGIRMRVETVTPETAKQYLKKNLDNYRVISMATVRMYAQEMKAGNWRLNGEAIVFDRDGKLKNGQHRLAAVVMSGAPVEMTIIEGVDTDVVIYDSGKTRNMKEMAIADGCDGATSTEVAMAAMVVANFRGQKPKGLVLKWLKEHYEDVRRAFRVCGANNSRNLSRRAACVLATYMALNIDKMKSYDLESFFEVFNSGSRDGMDGYETSSALVARRQFIERYKTTPNSKRMMQEQTELLIQAIRDFQKGKPRAVSYQIKDPLVCVELMDKIRKADGLTDAEGR